MEQQQPGGSASIEIPAGSLSVSPGLSFRGLIRSSVRSEQKVRAAVEAVSRLGPPIFLTGGSFRHDDRGFELIWPPLGADARGLPELVADWRSYPAVHIPEALDLARFVYRASSETDHQRPLRFLFSAPQVCRFSGSGGRREWVIVPLPLEGASLPDFVAASDISTAWLSGEELAGIATTDRVYLLGAVLYYVLIADLLPKDLLHGERLRRILSFRTGSRATARAVIQAAVPRDLISAGMDLANFICDLLAPSLGRMTPVEAVRKLEKFQEIFAAPLLASLWEAEGNAMRAVAILNAYALSAHRNEIPWQSLVRLRKATGDHKGAAEAEANVPRSPEEAVADTIVKTHQASRSGPEGRAEIERQVARLTQPGAAAIDPEEFLFLVYQSARLLGRAEESLRLLSRGFTVSWHKAIAGVLSARCAAERRSWIEASRLVRETRLIVSRMPDSGGGRGRYALAYLNLLDAVAHIEAVRSGYPPDYLSSALDRFEEVYSQLRASPSPGLNNSAIAWLAVLAEDTAARPGLQPLSQKVSSLRSTVGGGAAHAPSPLPEVPWFEESRFFSALNERTE